MKKIVQYLSPLLLIAALTPSAALAKGEITVEHENGDVDLYSGVTISNTDDILYFKTQEGDSILMITKNECDKEGELFVCNKARMGLDSYGVLEEIKVREIFLFINPTTQSQPIKGSNVTMTPSTILLEAVTEDGSYITGLGRIDNTIKPEGASR
ncbi:MAG: hypothetical protein AB4041_16180 [Microcystaceae cyanobacterium]